MTETTMISNHANGADGRVRGTIHIPYREGEGVGGYVLPIEAWDVTIYGLEPAAFYRDWTAQIQVLITSLESQNLIETLTSAMLSRLSQTNLILYMDQSHKTILRGSAIITQIAPQSEFSSKVARAVFTLKGTNTMIVESDSEGDAIFDSIPQMGVDMGDENKIRNCVEHTQVKHQLAVDRWERRMAALEMIDIERRKK